ncbi:arylamine N-acetyltransferase family protein [Sphingomonas sp.]|jgi:N-hydroxyarylamine O-acetyltransferase|uniref:arylamine N-acetyltransferase family protein n=1 Tax=Sphingomonas sp. TaxID=28214 RepID=UPI002E3104A2|nr:arylamine N-acetyltransferase [Sphingomonas sp.]HEX4694304.1 arylamine N-acetyltransferase [Sphingomonas sp.]
MSFDLDAYLARIRLPARATVDAHGLAAVQRAHRLAIPFENLDIRLGRGIRIDSESVFAKLVTARRGGYCFEQNRLFGDALAELGFTVRPLLARVWLGASETPGRTHTLLLVTIDGQDWIADAGFGGSYAPPMPLVAGAEAGAPDGALFRLSEDHRGWVLARNGHPAATDGRGGGGDWIDQFSFTLGPVAPIDLAMSNHWTATAPGTRFTDLVVVSIALPNGFASLTDRSYRRYAGGEETSALIDDPRVYRMRLGMMFGLDLSADEVAALRLF